MFRRLKVRFVLIMMIPVTCLLCAIMALIIHFTDRQMEQRSINMLRTAAFAPEKNQQGHHLQVADLPDASQAPGVENLPDASDVSPESSMEDRADDSSASRGEDQAGGSSQSRGEDQADGSSQSRGEDQAGGSSQSRGEDQTGGSSQSRREDRTGGSSQSRREDRTGAGTIRQPFFILETDGNGTIVSIRGSSFYDLSDEDAVNTLLKTAEKSAADPDVVSKATIKTGSKTATVSEDFRESEAETGTVTQDIRANEAEVFVLKDYKLRCLRISDPDGSLYAFADISEELSTRRHLFHICLLAGGLSLAAFALLSRILAQWFVRPLRDAWEQQQRFTADASHELKTPLTVLQTTAELLKEPDLDETRRRQFIGNILEMTHRMRGLVEDLLTLARSDSPSAAFSSSPVDLSRLTKMALLPYEPLLFEAGLTLREEIEDGIIIQGDDRQLKQVIGILLDNAIKYSHKPGEVNVSLKRKNTRRILLSVSNPGEELSGRELRKMFDRFYRLDASRTGDGSYGLGLAIAQAVVSRHNGKIWAESREGIITIRAELSSKTKETGPVA